VTTPKNLHLTEGHTLSYFYLFCLFASAVWDTMSGCARMDYVGIGWLISASAGTVDHYGFYPHEFPSTFFLPLCTASALPGAVFPFMGWFNRSEYLVGVIALMLRSESD
jgi:adiponectin receptor